MRYLLRHFNTVRRHRRIVFSECRACGLFWRGLVHDISKYSPIEFVSSARYFQGDRSPIEAEKARLGYSAAWFHHKGHNRHHWEYWTDFSSDGTVVAAKIPYIYVVEMVCDWIGAGKVYSKDKWTRKSPLTYYNQVRAGRYFHPDTESLILIFLNMIADHGLEPFHEAARGYGSYSKLREDYEQGNLSKYIHIANQ